MKLLLINNEPLFHQSIKHFVCDQLNHELRLAHSVEEGLRIIHKEQIDIILSDLNMPGADGYDLLDALAEPGNTFQGATVMLLNEYNVESEIMAIGKGAADILVKPVSVDLVAMILKKLEDQLSTKRELNILRQEFDQEVNLRLKSLRTELTELQKEHFAEFGTDRIGVYSDTMRQIVNLAKRVHADRLLSVLITGETGTGKEVIARLVHFGAENVKRPFISLNCSAIPASLFESELFGYERGAFTGSNREGKIGKLEMANGGTIFLDEIGDLPLDLQPKILRVIQEREMYRVGGTKSIPLDLRFVFATHRDLHSDVRKGTFRQDLFYRISTVYIEIPPLRQRKEEILPLAQMFLQRISQQKHIPLKFLKEETARLIKQYPWHGNIRELQNAMERAYLVTDSSEIPADCFPLLLPNVPLNLSGKRQRNLFIEFPEGGVSLQDLIGKLVRKALALHDGNNSQTARYLGISLNRLKRIIREQEEHS